MKLSIIVVVVFIEMEKSESAERSFSIMSEQQQPN